MSRHFLASLVLFTWLAVPAAAQPPQAESSASQVADVSSKNQVIEVRTYSLKDEAAEKRLDAYLETALLPALQRQGLGPIGVLDQHGAADQIEVTVIIPGPSFEAIATATKKLASDADYQAAAKEYLDTPGRQTPLKRIRSEMLLAFDCWPQVTVPAQKEAGKPRFFELRTYESATEKLGELKVEMFNEGEVPIFLEADIMPVFMGQAIIGDMQPNLTYMVVFDDEDAMKAGWPRFMRSDSWKVLSGVERYKGTVSRNRKSYWTPKAYSQL